MFQIAGVHHRTVRNLPDGTFDLNEVGAKYHDPANDDDHEAWTALVCIENTHNKAGGKAVPIGWIKEVSRMILFKYKQYNYNSITDNVINALTIQSKF